MRIIRCYYAKVGREYYPSSSVKIYRKVQPKSSAQKPSQQLPASESVQLRQHEQHHSKMPATTSISQSSPVSGEYAENLVKIQMISKNLHEQIFRQKPRQLGSSEENTKANRYIAELQRHGVNTESTERLADVCLRLPPLHGGNIEEHFHAIAKEQVEPYEQLLLPLVQCEKLPLRPSRWSLSEGWTAYDADTGRATACDYPTDNGIVFDIEVCVNEGQAPTMATAVSTRCWYSWVSPQLMKIKTKPQSPNTSLLKCTIEDLIPLGRHGPKIIVGHNVSYDRARLREQYLIEDTGARFIDTMSLHVCVSGITSYQRAMLKSKKEPSMEDTDWMAQSSLNSLAEVHRLYCGGETVSKEPRNVFLEGSLNDIRNDFQNLMTYCANDVAATHRVLRILYPLFKERFSNPVTLAGMLEIGSAYLPVNSNWLRYINESNLAYEDLSIEAKYHLAQRANEACALLNGEKYRQNLWLWDEDWSVQELKMKQPKVRVRRAQVPPTTKDKAEKSNENSLQKKFQHLYDMRALLPARRPLLPGYPAWYRKLCEKPTRSGVSIAEWRPGPTAISTGMQIAPKLLSLCWEGYPLHYHKEHGWGFLVPFRVEHTSADDIDNSAPLIPIDELVKRCPIPEFARAAATAAESEYAFGALHGELEVQLGKREFYSKAKKDHTAGQYTGSGVWCNQVLQQCCYFIKLPHKNGNSFRVGNPLSKDFLNKFSENVLSSGEDAENGGGSASRVIEIARMMSYWRNNRDRIMGQMVVWLPKHYLPKRVTMQHDGETTDGDDDDDDDNSLLDYGAICPQIVACGTLTRRAMEPTWLTASNSQRERIGSELRAMVQAPPSYKIVGADVDSQELWIASVLGDASAYGIHGATPLGWMTLSGSKSNGSDMHSVTAKAVGISRDHAKVINYARIYGAGQNFAESLLKQFNPTFSATEAKSKAMKMFSITKGKRIFKLREEFLDQLDDRNYTSYEVFKIAASYNRPINEIFYPSRWQGGTESAMFNRLEEIAMQDKPQTPFLNCRLSRAIESNHANENRFLPTRINWVVQSGAVDFLHLMLVSMRWLMGPNARFCLSFHDELRYLVKEEQAYKAALAMHVTNLLTRSFCSSRIGLTDLPMSVAFFSSVEVDSVLRKECTMDCKTPSNPHGLQVGYGIEPGESLNIYETIKKAGGNDLRQWEWLK